jgi:hypothetical protein
MVAPFVMVPLRPRPYFLVTFEQFLFSHYQDGMDEPVAPPERLSRWSRDPERNDAGKPKAIQLTKRDIEIFKLLVRFPYLPMDDIHAFVGGSLINLARRLGLLSRRPNLYLNRPHQQRLADANYRRLIYELDERGRATLADLGLPHSPKSPSQNFIKDCRAFLA